VRDVPDGPVSVQVGRYTLYRAIASGGMATVHLGRMHSAVGVTRMVAIKRVHPQFSTEPEFASMFFDEARLSLRIQHPNVVPTFDVVAENGELLLVMDYVHGDSLSSLWRRVALRGEAIPPHIASAIVGGALAGLHAAHELRGEDGQPLGIVHRDVSPQNILVGVDGASRVLDFGVAKAANRLHSTEQGKVKGKIAYMAPEQLLATPLDQRADVFAASVVLWEALTGRRLFESDGPGAVAIAVLSRELLPPSAVNPALDAAIDAVVMKGLSRQVETRYPSAEAMAIDLERALPPASPRVVGEWVQETARDILSSRAGFIADVESDGSGVRVPMPVERPEARSGIDELPSQVDASGGAVPERTATLVSTMLVTPSTPTAPPVRRPRALAAVLVGLALVALVLVTLQRSSGTVAGSAAPITPMSASPPPPSDTAAEPSPALPSAQPVAASKPSASSASVAHTKEPPLRVAPRGPGARPAHPKPAVDCTNPFVVDGNGIRVPRAECF
jgi:eukaryotic-like serine/threonine-protein kinase